MGGKAAPAAVKRPPSLTAERYLALIRELLGLFESQGQITTWERHRRHIVALAGMEQEVIRETHAVLALDKAGLHAATAVHIRKCLEFAVIAQWIHLTPKGLDAFTWDSREETKKLVKEARATNVIIPEDLIAEITRQPDTGPPDEAKVVANFRAVAETFGPHAGIYLMYKSLCAETHPNIGSITNHLQEDPNGSEGYGFILDGGQRSGAWLFTLTISLIWIARVVDDRVQYKPRKKDLQRIAREVGVPSLLKRLHREASADRATANPA